MEYQTLNNGIKIPLLGFGIWQMFDQAECQRAVEDALSVGYRLIDTASLYRNEEAVGQAIKASGIPREDVFLTSKAWISQLGYQDTKLAFKETLRKLDTDYLDLYLIHQPFGDLHGAWRAMTDLYQEGHIRAIGVSNFSTGRLADFALQTPIVPAVNQIELHPYKQHRLIQEADKSFGTLTQAWAPFHRGQDGIFQDPILTSIADKHQKTVAQVILRWQTQQGILTIPKTSHLERMRENFDSFGFYLDKADLEAITSLDRYPQAYGPDESIDRIKHLLAYNI